MRNLSIRESLALVAPLLVVISQASGQAYKITDPDFDYEGFLGPRAVPRPPRDAFGSRMKIPLESYYRLGREPSPLSLVPPEPEGPPVLANTPAAVSAVPKTPSPGSPPATKGRVPVRVASKVLPLEERVGRVGDAEEQAKRSLISNQETLQTNMRALLQAHEKAPGLDLAKEAERIQLLVYMLDRAVERGEAVTRDVAAFKASFEQWHRVTQEAAPVYREASEFFRKKAAESAFPQEKSLHLASSKWYAARAARAELRAAMTLPGEFSTEVERVRAMTGAIKLLRDFVVKDRNYFDTDNDFNESVSEFMAAFQGVKNILDEWSSKLLEDLEEVEGPAEAPPAGRNPAPPAPARQASRAS